MIDTSLFIKFISDWHVGSGLGDGAVADAVLNRDVNGLPVIPGSAIKGALREGSWRLALCDQENLGWLTDYVFGTGSNEQTENRPGIITVGEGLLPEDLREWLLAQDDAERREFVSDMTDIRQQTRLDKCKMVVPHSLRSVECGIPGLEFKSCLTLRAPEVASAWLAGWLAAVCACVKSVGGDRARGLGRCHLELAIDADAALPGPLPDVLQDIRRKWRTK